MPHRTPRTRHYGSARLSLLLVAICVLISTSTINTATATAVSEQDASTVESRLASAQTAADRAAGRLAHLHTAEADARNRITDGEARIADLIRERDELRIVLELRAVEVYKRGNRVSSLAFVSSVDDVDKQSRRHVYLERVLRSDTQAINEIATVNERLEHERTAVRAAQKIVSSAQDAAAAEDAELAEALRRVAAERSVLASDRGGHEPAPATRALATAAASPEAIRTKHRATFPLPASAVNERHPKSNDPACPVAGPVTYTDTFGASRSGGRRHKGVDMLAENGTPLAAITSGSIARAGSGGLGGISLYLQGDNGSLYYYAHNSSNIVEPGTRVDAGDIIGYVGDTGNARGTPHLHFEVDSGSANPTTVVDHACADRP